MFSSSTKAFRDFKNRESLCKNHKSCCSWCPYSTSRQNLQPSAQNFKENNLQAPPFSAKVEPGQGLLAYSDRLSSFCKPTFCKPERLMEVPKYSECFPNYRPKHHKLSFLDDPPYTAPVNYFMNNRPYYPQDLFGHNSFVAFEDDDEDNEWDTYCRYCKGCCKHKQSNTNTSANRRSSVLTSSSLRNRKSYCVDCGEVITRSDMYLRPLSKTRPTDVMPPHLSLRNRQSFSRNWAEMIPRPEIQIKTSTAGRPSTYSNDYTCYRSILPGWVTNHPVKRDWCD